MTDDKKEDITAKPKSKKLTHIKLTSHPESSGIRPLPIHWGAASATERGPIIATVTKADHRNAIGTHSGSYSVYRALAIAAGTLNPVHIPDLTDTMPAESLGPFPQWSNPKSIVSLDPYGHMIADAFRSYLTAGYDIRPTIAITKAHINMPEFEQSIAAGRLKPDGVILKENGEVVVTKAAIEPVWYLPGIAERFGTDEAELRRCLFEHTGGMYPELITRPDLEVFLPPIGGMTCYFFGNVAAISNPNVELSCRVHDECNGSDVFGSDICTCRPYLEHGIEVCIESAQRGGTGLIVYNRKEGRALGEVTKFLVYNARKRQQGGDRAEKYFERTECVAGVQDMRFQELMPDVLQWLGITKIQRFVSMSNMKYDAIVRSGIQIEERVEIPKELIPADAMVEMDAKKAAGYFSDPNEKPQDKELKKAKGRSLNE
jgi:GTP cyclohydrolase II